MMQTMLFHRLFSFGKMCRRRIGAVFPLRWLASATDEKSVQVSRRRALTFLLDQKSNKKIKAWI